MESSIFLARVFGLYFAIMGLLLFIRSEQSIQIIRDFYQNRVLVFAVAWVTLIMGILIVVGHNIWELNWKGIITLLGYLTLLKGVTHLYIPEIMMKINLSENKNIHRLVYGAFFIFGLGLLYVSFMKN